MRNKTLAERLEDTMSPLKVMWQKLQCANLESKRNIKRCVQRYRRGWADEDTWSIDYWFVYCIVPMLENIKDAGHPYAYDDEEEMTQEKWNAILDEMIVGFKLYDDIICQGGKEIPGKKTKYSFNREDQRKFNRSMRLFAKYFGALWT